MKHLYFVVVSALLSACPASASSMEDACEEVLLERLLAPSSYKRIEFKHMEFPMPRSEVEEWLQNSEPSESVRLYQMERFDAGVLSPVRFGLVITYSALNSHGELVKEIATCQYANLRGDASGAAHFNVYVNGMSKIDYLAEQIKRLGN